MANTVQASQAGTIQVGSFTVNRLGFGAMRITGEGIWGMPDVPADAKALLTHAVDDLGINFIDTADSYGPEVSEKLIAETLNPYKNIVVATKGGMERPGPGEWRTNCSPEHLRNACEASRERLGISFIDIYQLHNVDPAVPFEISLQTLIDLQSEGKIKHIGLSNVEPEHLLKALEMTEIVSVQNNYNLFNDEHEDVLRICEERGIAFIPYFPLGDGDLTAHDGVLAPFAEKHHATTGQIALAWLLHHSEMMLPIPGTGTIEHLDENVAAAAIKLDEEDMRQLDALRGQG